MTLSVRETRNWHRAALAVLLADVALIVYAYSLRPHWWLVVAAGFFLALVVRLVGELRRLREPGVRA
jgi:hypothetical protein